MRTFYQTIPQTDVYSEGGIDELAFKLHVDTGRSASCCEPAKYAHAFVFTSIEYYVRFLSSIMPNLGLCPLSCSAYPIQLDLGA